MSNPKGKQRMINGQLMTVRQAYQTCGNHHCQCYRPGGKKHGPYWYAYQRVDGKLKSHYIGKSLPEGAEA